MTAPMYIGVHNELPEPGFIRRLPFLNIIMTSQSYVLGVGMTQFLKPRRTRECEIVLNIAPLYIKVSQWLIMVLQFLTI